MSSPKKRVLIGLFGLYRTFKRTADLLFEHVILPNSNDFEFDIIINTDYECSPLTANRPISNNTYESVDQLREDLTAVYNRNGQLKDIIIYNKETNFVVFPWIVVYKRIQQILKNRFDNNDTYDICIMMRLDIIISSVLNLNEVNNEVVFISGSFTRQGYLHDRDVFDAALYGSFDAFVYWIYSTVQYFESITNLKRESVGFFDRTQFCKNEIIEKYAKYELYRHHIYANDNIYVLLGAVKLNHSDCSTFDHYNFKGDVVPYSFVQHYDIPSDHMIRNLLYNINSIFQFSTFHLSENRNGILHYIIR